MATKVWHGHLSLGLVCVPVYLNVAARDKKIALNTFHAECNGPVSMPKFCATCNKQIDGTEIYKGFKTGDKIVPITDVELEQIVPETGHSIEITSTVRMVEIDTMYFAESFFLLPDQAGKKGYSLLVKVLADTGRVGVAQLCKGGREHMIALRPKGNGLTVHYLWYENEIAKNPEFESLEMAKLSAGEIKAGTQLVESLASSFNPAEFENGYLNRLTTLIDSKLDKSIAAPTPVKGVLAAPTQDLMAALSASLANPNPRRRAIKLEDQPKAAKGKKGKRAA